MGKRLRGAFKMSSTPDIRLASFAVVMFLSLQVPVMVCQNAAISGCADSQLVNSSLTLNCRYIGKGEVVAVYWYNGSNSDILALKPGSNVPHCDVFSRIDISFDPHRISYTCNALSNVYTLTINPLQMLDNNVTWSCTFIDPAPDPVKAKCIIHLSGAIDVTAGDDRSSSLVNTVLYIVCSVIFFIVVVTIIVIALRKRKRGTCKTGRQHREQDDEESHSLQQDQREEPKQLSRCRQVSETEMTIVHDSL